MEEVTTETLEFWQGGNNHYKIVVRLKFGKNMSRPVLDRRPKYLVCLLYAVTKSNIKM